MASPIFQISAADMKTKLNPLSLPNLFGYGGTGQLTEAAVDEIIAEQEDEIADMLPEKYRKLLRHVEGERIVADATAGQTTANLGLFPATSGSLVLYKDFGGQSAMPQGGGPIGSTAYQYRNRSQAMTVTTDYSINYTTGAIVLVTALSAGQRIFGDYEHAAAYKCKSLRFVVKNMAAAEIGRELPFNSDQREEAFAKFDQWEQRANRVLEKMWGVDGVFKGIDLFDKLDLVEETRISRRTGPIPITGAW